MFVVILADLDWSSPLIPLLTINLLGGHEMTKGCVCGLQPCTKDGIAGHSVSEQWFKEPE